jgi:hypothetical protein
MGCLERGDADEATPSVMGRPWDLLPEDHTDHPPEGDWVSREGMTSYARRLAHVCIHVCIQV